MGGAPMPRFNASRLAVLFPAMNPPPDDWIARAQELLSERRARGLLRQRQVIQQVDSTHVLIDGVRYINFSGNDYLGLTHHPAIVAALRSVTTTGSGAAGLISGYTDSHRNAEANIASWKGVESAVMLPSGYQANLAAVQTLAAIGETFPDGARFLIDKLAHASLIDAARATQMPMRVFPHNNLAKLRRLLETAPPPGQQLQVVLTESIFSMDGDAADLRGIAQLKAAHAFVLLLDEAHASGVYGPSGAGFAAELALGHVVDVSVVTLSKAIGCVGGAVCCPRVFRDALLNFGRAYIYSTSIPPAIAVAVTSAIDVMRAQPHRQQRVRELASRVRNELTTAGMKIPAGDSPIVPIVVGSEHAALKAAEELKREGLLVIPVRPPTVPPASSRLRVTLSCEHTDDEISQLLRRIKRIGPHRT
jgi:8-amino-7-oxononanoate synthase